MAIVFTLVVVFAYVENPAVHVSSEELKQDKSEDVVEERPTVHESSEELNPDKGEDVVEELLPCVLGFGLCSLMMAFAMLRYIIS